jgi:predicted amidophosphoribosyltransferase
MEPEKRRLDEISEIVLVCKRCHQPVGTWRDVPPWCPHCTTPAEKAQRSPAEKERIDFIEQLMDLMHTAILKADELPYEIRLEFKR